jgi:hypothetical protein
MDALERALDNVRSGRDLRAEAEADVDGDSDEDGRLNRLSRDDLYKRAQEEGIPGRTKMSKKELADALTQHRD